MKHPISAARERTPRSAFTLIELLVVIAIIAVLAVVVVLTLNPAEMLKEARDVNRLSDLSTLQSAIDLYSTNQAMGGSSNALGNSNIIYISVPDSTLTGNQTSTCSSLDLPALPAGYTYQCSSPSAYRTPNGSGWLPLDFSSITSGSPLGSLPVDPVNQSSTRLYYTYTTNGTQYEITTPMESSKYQLGGSSDVIANDGSPLTTEYAKGTNLTLEPLDYGDPGLGGYWPLDEGTGTVVYDLSGNNATGSWSGIPSGSSGYYDSGGPNGYLWSGYLLGGATDTVSVPLPQASRFTNSFSVVYWINPASWGAWAGHIGINGDEWYCQFNNTSNQVYCAINKQANGFIYGGNLSVGVWSQVVFVYDGNSMVLYVNGVRIAGPVSDPGQNFSADPTWNLYIPGSSLTGGIAGVRLYDRALSSAEVSALYAKGN